MAVFLFIPLSMLTSTDKTANFVAVLWIMGLAGVLLTPRIHFPLLLGSYTISFIAYFSLVFRKNEISLSLGLSLAFIIRLLSLGFNPQLSDDYFRFIWDGMVLHQGINPAAYLPSYLVQHPELIMTDATLYSLLNSPDYYSVYPPLVQFIFYVSYSISHLSIGGNLLFYKLVLLAADGLVVYLLYFILKKYMLPVKRVLIYALNPLIIIEFAGNVHMDGLMIAGLLGAVALSYTKTPVQSSFSMALSIAAKLFSLILMPFMPREMYWKKIIAWGLMTMTITFLLFLSFFHFDSGWLQGVGLWFHTFEFNASFYYLIRELDELWRGYENIKLIGPLMAGMTGILIFIVWLLYIIKNKWHWSTAMVIVLTIYFLMTTTLHPWYLGTLLAISVISGHLYPIAWTYLVFLSYSHYSDGGFSEKFIYIWAEYILLFGWMIFEWLQYRKR